MEENKKKKVNLAVDPMAQMLQEFWLLINLNKKHKENNFNIQFQYHLLSLIDMLTNFLILKILPSIKL